MSLNFYRKKRKMNSEINVTPLIDVMLVLLVIFMVTAPMMNNNIKIELPSTTSSPSKSSSPQKNIEIFLDANGKIFINEMPIRAEELTGKIKAIAAQIESNSVIVKADKSIAYGDVVRLMDEIKLAGVPKVMLVTKIADNRRN